MPRVFSSALVPPLSSWEKCHFHCYSLLNIFFNNMTAVILPFICILPAVLRSLLSSPLLPCVHSPLLSVLFSHFVRTRRTQKSCMIHKCLRAQFLMLPVSRKFSPSFFCTVMQCYSTRDFSCDFWHTFCTLSQRLECCAYSSPLVCCYCCSVMMNMQKFNTTDITDN